MADTTSASLATVSTSSSALAALAPLVEAARAYVAAAQSDATRKAYRASWVAFTTWASSNGLVAMPATPETVALYVASLANDGRKAATIDKALVAISGAHRAAGVEVPTIHELVRQTRRGVRRTIGTAQTRKAALPLDALRTIAHELTVDGSLRALRDRALLLVGFAGAFRRSELVALNVEDVRFEEGGVVVTVRSSKTDQEGAGVEVGLPFGSEPATCPVRTLRAWLSAAGIEAGPLFRGVNRHGHLASERLTDRAVALVVKERIGAHGLDASTFGGHSLRAGLATAAAKAGKAESQIMRQTRHRSVEMVRRYVRAATVFDHNAASGLL